jgi:tubulin-like protein CetZ
LNKKPIMIIGVGQCGGNIADIAESKGFPTLAINSYQGDLDSLSHVTNRIHLKGYNGAGKDRSKGRVAFRDNLEEVITKIQLVAENVDIIMVAFSSDGGTGSGSGPFIINVLSDIMPDKVVGAIVALPVLSSPVGSLANSSECISELSSIENLGACLFIDNEKLGTKVTNKRDLYHITNTEVISHLEAVVDASQKKSTEGNFDGADLVSVMTARGSMIIDRILTKKNDNFNQRIKDGWGEGSIYITPEYDQKVINAGIIYQVPIELVKEIDKGEIFHQVGMPLEIFEGFYGYDKSPSITTILSGLSFPFKRLQVMEELIEMAKVKIEENLQSSYTQKFETQAGWLSKVRFKPKKEKEEGSISDKLKKYM